MSRLVSYRAKVPANIKLRIEETLATTMYLVQTTGPTSYVIQEQNSDKKHKVLIGMLQTCSCGDGDVCIHILFVMLKVLRVPATTPIVWQKSLIDSEIEGLLRGDFRADPRPQAPKHNNNFLKRRAKDGGADVAVVATDGAEVIEAQRHELVEGEVCAICQEDMIADQPLTYCRKGCGNNFHIECMKVFGESRKQSKEHIICPLCRHDWGDLALTELKKAMDVANNAPNVHKGVTCKKCQAKPLRNERYRCIQCKNVDLCDHCFKANAHINHSFVSKKQVNDPWTPALRSSQRRSSIPSELVDELQSRDLTTNDYDLLLELDQREKFPIQDYLLSTLSGGQKVSAANAKSFGEPGATCSVCRQSLRIQADVRAILCGHAFHESCLARSLLGQVYSCPFPGCDHIMFPGLYCWMTKKKATTLDGSAEQAKLPGSGEHVAFDPLLCVVPVQGGGNSLATGRQSQQKQPAKPVSRGVKSRAAPPILEPSDVESLSIGNISIGHQLPSIEASSTSQSKRLKKPVESKRLPTRDALPALVNQEMSTDDRLKHAEQLRMEHRQLEKDRHRKQTMERQERVRQNQSNNQSDHEALNKLLPQLGLPQLLGPQHPRTDLPRPRQGTAPHHPGRAAKEPSKEKRNHTTTPAQNEMPSLSVTSIR